MKYIIGGLIVIVVLCGIIIPITGLHYVTGQGHHVGYITATETSGLIWKTGTAYVKSDAQSSQEDVYCVMDDSVLAQLKDAAEKKEKVEVTHISYFSPGIKNCSGEGAIIKSVSVLQ